MRIKLFLALGGAALLATSVSHAAPGDRFRERIRERIAQRMMAQQQQGPVTPPTSTFAYGKDPLQNLDFWKSASGSGPAPLIVFVHGGGWKRGSKDNASSRYAPAHFTQEGYAFASINYRLVPEAKVEDQAEDVARAVKALIDRSGELGIDPKRVVIMGHSAGAHLVALVGTDERYVRKAGIFLDDLKGVIPIDGAAYDVPAQTKDGPQIMQQTYTQAFGSDPARQRALSPTLQAMAPNAPAFLLIHVQRPDGVRQAEALEKALKAGGTKVQRNGFPGEGLQGHAEINRRLGDPDYAATGVVDAWLKEVFGK